MSAFKGMGGVFNNKHYLQNMLRLYTHTSPTKKMTSKKEKQY